MTEKLPIILALGAAILVLALLPAIIAFTTRHPERRTIAALAPGGILSLILWAALMAWAIGGKRNDSVIGRYADRLKGSGLLLPAAIALVAAGLATAFFLS